MEQQRIVTKVLVQNFLEKKNISWNGFALIKGKIKEPQDKDFNDKMMMLFVKNPFEPAPRFRPFYIGEQTFVQSMQRGEQIYQEDYSEDWIEHLNRYYNPTKEIQSQEEKQEELDTILI